MTKPSDNLDELIRETSRARHGERAKAKRKLSDKVHAMLREETK